MKKFSPTPIHFIRFTFVLQVVMLCAFFQGWANVIEPSQKEGISFATLELNSHSFNAKKEARLIIYPNKSIWNVVLPSFIL
ncbi:hypothetical protein Q2T40_03305 [Winogradskyella maritima]|nr:hypothetical protein [Winogradskyella maritima]